MYRVQIIGFFLLILISHILLIPFSTAGEIKPLLFKNVRVFDGKQVLENSDVFVERGQIRLVGPTQTLNIPHRSDVEIIDGSDKTLLPGFIDAHTHIVGEALRLPPRFGVTTVLDMFMAHEWMTQLEKEQKSGSTPFHADFLSSGICATAPGGHGTEYGMNIPTISSPQDADRFVEERIREGSDYIKIVYDDAKTYGLNLPTLNKETLKALVEAAHKRKKMAIVHVWSLWEAVDAVEAGADGLGHMFSDQLPTEEFARMMARKKIFVIPTMTILESAHRNWGGKKLIDDKRIGPLLEEAEKTNLLSTLPRLPGATTEYSIGEKGLKILYDNGVNILAGTDAPNYGTAHGASLHREFELLKEAGMKPIDILASATSLPAQFFGLSDRGNIAPGKRADLVLVNGNPILNMDNTKNIAGVWKAGVWISIRKSEGFGPQAVVKVEFNNVWYEAVVLQVKESHGINAYQIQFERSRLFEWVAPNRIISVETENPSPVGDVKYPAHLKFVLPGVKVSVEYNGQWYPATLVRVKESYGVDVYHIKYTQSDLEEWVAPNRIKSAGGAH